MNTPIKYAEDSGVYTKNIGLHTKLGNYIPEAISRQKDKKQHLKCLRLQLGMLPSQALAMPSDTSMIFNMATD